MKTISGSILLACLFFLSACNPVYVVRAAYEESKILLSRQDIKKLLDNPATNKQLKDKLELVRSVRAYAVSAGLVNDGSFTQYSQLTDSQQPLVWVLMASELDKFELKTWWFPIVGSVPYKGFFEKEDALEQAQSLESEGYETHIRGADAFSTLGWFDDPVLSTTLSNPDHVIVNIVFHEMLHGTVWIKGDVAFNESAANYFGHVMSVKYFRSELKRCHKKCSPKQKLALKNALYHSQKAYKDLLEFTEKLNLLYQDLKSLYNSSQSKDCKIKERQLIFNKHQKSWQTAPIAPGDMQKINNAAIMQRMVYSTKINLFEAAYTKCDRSSRCFIELFKKFNQENTKNPFKELKKFIS